AKRRMMVYLAQFGHLTRRFAAPSPKGRGRSTAPTVQRALNEVRRRVSPANHRLEDRSRNPKNGNEALGPHGNLRRANAQYRQIWRRLPAAQGSGACARSWMSRLRDVARNDR